MGAGGGNGVARRGRVVGSLLAVTLAGFALPGAGARAAYLPYESNPAAASNDEVTLVVWDDARAGTDADIYGARVTADGTVLDPKGFPVAAAFGDQLYPQVSWDGTSFFVTWLDERTNPEYDRLVWGARVAPDGRVLDPHGVMISPSYADGPGPMAWNGVHHLVTWRYRDELSNYHLEGVRIDANGTVIDPEPIHLVTGDPHWPSLASAGGTWVLAWSTWSADELRAVRVAPTGAVLDDPPILLAPDGPGTIEGVAAAASSSGYLVTWGNDRTTTDKDETLLFARRIGAGGGLLDAEPIALGIDAVDYWPTAGWSGDRYLILWTSTSDFFGERDLFVRGLHPDGTLDPPSQISGARGKQENASYAVGGSGGLAVWQDSRSFEDLDVYGRRLSTPGEPEGAEIAISTIGRDATHFPRQVTLRTRRHVVFEGRVTLSGHEPRCTAGITIQLQRRGGSGWAAWGEYRTRADGSFRARAPDYPDRYRVVAPETRIGDVVCERAVSPVRRHRH